MCVCAAHIKSLICMYVAKARKKNKNKNKSLPVNDVNANAEQFTAISRRQQYKIKLKIPIKKEGKKRALRPFEKQQQTSIRVRVCECSFKCHL